MSHLYNNNLSGFARRATVGIHQALAKVSRSVKLKPIVDYYHLDNFADVLSARANPHLHTEFCYRELIGFTQEVQTEILQGILSGNHPVVAARRVGIPRAKLESWISLGNQGIPPFAEFFTECLKASGEASASQMKTLLEGQKGPSSAAKWWLQVMEPELYAGRNSDSGSSSGGSTTVNNTTNNVVAFMDLKPNERFSVIKDFRLPSGNLEDYMGLIRPPGEE